MKRFAPCLLIGLLLVVAPPAHSQPADGPDADSPPVYLVELLVFRHAEGASDRRRAPSPAHFSRFVDPHLVAAADRTADRALQTLRARLPMLPAPGRADEDTPRLVSEAMTLNPMPIFYADLGLQSTDMRRAMDRLMDSPGHQPVSAAAWIQRAPRRRSTPAIRVHDRTLVEMRTTGRRGLPLFFPAGLRIPVAVTGDGRVVQRRLFRPAAPALAVYRLDGTARLRRRQFLHLDLDLVWQERAPRIGETATSEAAPEEQDGREWLLHRLEQTRVVEPGRLEYFDSSLFGVLARVERLQQVVPEPPPRAPRPAENAAAPPVATDPGG